MTSLFLTAVAFAQTTPSASPGTQAPGDGGFVQMAITIGMLIMIFYLVILRPQKNEQRKREALLNAMAKGDAVMTSGGILGTIESVDPAKGIVTVSVAPKVSIKFARVAITSVTKKKDAKEAAESEASAS